MKRGFLILALAAAGILTSCGGGGGAAPSVNSGDSRVDDVRMDIDSLRSDAMALGNVAGADELLEKIKGLVDDIDAARKTIDELLEEIKQLRADIMKLAALPNCGENEEANGQNCICKTGYERINGNCLMPPNCGENEEANGQNCICKTGYERINGNCLIPPNCGENEKANGQNCICKTGYERINGNCLIPPNCGENEEANGQNCICKTGYERINGNCLMPPNCGENEEANGQNCICKTGYERINGNCLIPPNCGENEEANGQNCKCVSGYVRKNDACVISVYNTPEYQRSTALSLANVLPAYEAGAFGQSVTVIVLEFQYHRTHEDIAPNLITTATTLQGVENSFPAGHGTAVAGILGAVFGNANSTHGVAPSVKMWATGYAGGNSPHLMQHIPFAIEREIEIVNRSHNIIGDISYHTEADARASNDLRRFAAEYDAALGDADIVEVVAAGNYHTPTPPPPPQRAAYTPILAPDTEDNMIIVVNIKENEEEPADTSKICGLAKRWCLAAYGDGTLAPNAGGSYSDFPGTSAATPVVSGAMAVLKSFRPSLSITVIRQVLLESARPLGTRKDNPAEQDDMFGWGALDVGNGIATLMAMKTQNGILYDDLRESLPGEFAHLRGRLSDVSVALRITDRSYYNMRLSDIVGGSGESAAANIGDAAEEMQADDYAAGESFRFWGGLDYDGGKSNYIGEGGGIFSAAAAEDIGGYMRWTTANYGGISAFGEYGRTAIKADYGGNPLIAAVDNARAEEWTMGIQYRDLWRKDDNIILSARQESRISGGNMILRYPVADGDSHKAFIGETPQTIRTETTKIPIKQKPQTIWTLGYTREWQSGKWSAATEWNTAKNKSAFSAAIVINL